MIEATTDQLLDSLADVAERAERYGATVQQADTGNVQWLTAGDDLLMDLVIVPPAAAASTGAQINLQERWRTIGHERWELTQYGYEIRDRELDYRRALHQHDVDRFVRAFGVATHEHCESTLGHAACAHYGGQPCRGALDGLDRLYETWLERAKPDCGRLRCLD